MITFEMRADPRLSTEPRECGATEPEAGEESRRSTRCKRSTSSGRDRTAWPPVMLSWLRLSHKKNIYWLTGSSKSGKLHRFFENILNKCSLTQ
jgi:hypothetical protein